MLRVAAVRPVVLPLLLAACVDLPDGWEGARPVASLVQQACDGNPYEGTHVERVEAVDGEDLDHLAVREAHFRCAQDVEGFQVVEDGVARVLVQPIDTRPTAIAGCDCLYDLDIVLDVDTPPEAVEVWRRWDHESGDDARSRWAPCREATPTRAEARGSPLPLLQGTAGSTTAAGASTSSIPGTPHRTTMPNRNANTARAIPSIFHFPGSGMVPPSSRTRHRPRPRAR